ncbi:bifunctional (p)ppGpp synthetase/guanosine-3',5'-bis(diphosphate) 3'-pyrophosphohydrolase [Erysipelothrix sp. HDW6C]|uniref:RelA/SpoT family protein n=1 Tax=Erysipelothrix sp. HDW6C TaxID=2714930 RepID=UPI00140E19D3|nr:bifunctional (p)ppGpp synthetase/guanosine-3',5'-bis(diphosphate) 3'-pyrophosphohydrolase [Erysipelothrix sp. HDW6C]QIK70365.1 bifunctional (p)ppGpp synthetase/guanosine-3',5'-bis(diphosphate) 3'-pyrophosphohydrolase [Erysipelothrix sp. HDW6C]
MNQFKDISFDMLMDEAKKYITREDNLELISHAYHYAEEKHSGQYRKSGEPYIVHILHVGYILADLGMSPTTIAAGLLHDVVEDTGVTKEELAREFNDEIATLVESVTKIGNIEFKDEKEYLAANHRKIFIAMAKDVRVIFIKLVDRLHNMRTLQYQSPEKQQKIAAETLDVYAPIAHRLGLGEIKNELEDLSFSYLHRDRYYEIARLVDSRKAERDASVTSMITDIAELLLENNIKFNIFGRSKHLYSIYKKMTTKNKRFDEILDLLAIRIITETELNCYEILGHIHATYRPIPGRLKDYIAMPKMNMYQSLHTTIVGDEGNIFEVQIRTKRMDEIAERGVAAHWRYKEGSTNTETNQREIEDRLSWFRDFNMLTEGVNQTAEDYMSLLQKDIFEANVYVMTPKGRVIDLPNGATPIDFAYRIHTEVGHQTVGAIVNGTLVPLNTKLKTGDVVQLRTNKQSTPSEDWLKVVKTAHARNKIRSFILKKQTEDKAIYISKGEALFRDECRRRNVDEKDLKGSKKLESVYKDFSVNSYDDLMFAIATKSLSMSALFEKLDIKANHDGETKLDRVVARNVQQSRSSGSKTGVRVPGIDSMMISLSQCCNPVFGDDIVGYVTKGSGVKVHRKDCPNIHNDDSRLIDVYWDEDSSHGEYEVMLSIMSTDRSFLLTDLVTIASQLKVKLNAVNSEIDDDKIHVNTTMRVVVRDTDHLRNLIANLRKVDSVLRVDRVTL